MGMSKAKALTAVAGAIVLSTIVGPARAADVAFINEQKPGEMAAVRLGGTPVLNAKGENIGNVSDVILDANGQAKSLVVGVGGFLGVGAKEVAVPYSAIKFGEILNSRRLVVLDVTKEQLLAAPAYKATDPGKTERAKQKANEWLKVAKDKAAELTKQAQDAMKGGGDKPTAPAPK